MEKFIYPPHYKRKNKNFIPFLNSSTKFLIREKIIGKYVAQRLRYMKSSFAGFGWAKCNEWISYAVLCVPTRYEESATGSERSGEVIFLSLLFFCREIFSLFENLIFFVLKNEWGVRGEFHFSKLLILFQGLIETS